MPAPTQSDAIDTDVSDQPSTVTPPTARELMMERIAAENEVRVAKDFDGLDEDADIDPDNPDGDQLALQTQPVAQAPAPQHKVHTVKIDGEERTVTDDELIRSYQKNAAADRRLEEATNLLREANERATQVAAQPQPVAEAQPEFKAQVKSVLSKLYEGDEESASAALADLLMKTGRGGDQPTPASPNIDIDQLTMQIQQKMDIDKAFETIKSDYPDLIADPDLEMLTAMKINRAVASGTPRAQAMITAASEIYKSVGKVPTGRQGDTKPAQSQRLENKQRLDLVKPASGVASLKTSVEEDNPSSVIAEMAQRRLGQSMPRRVA